MSVSVADRKWEHLYPDFRIRLRAVFDDCEAQALKLKLVEGYRSQERQRWLYGQGRPGDPYYHPGPIVAGTPFSKWHAAGLAADCYKVSNGIIIWDFTNAELTLYRGRMAAHGLAQTAFAGDYGHCELHNLATRVEALAWVQSGFQDASVRESITVQVRGVAVLQADGYVDENNRSWGWIRPIADAMGAQIDRVGSQTLDLSLGPANLTLDFKRQFGRAYVALAGLDNFGGFNVQWIPPATVDIVLPG